MEPAVNLGVKQQGDRSPDSVPPRPKSRRVLARISYAFGQLHPAVGVLVLLAVSLVLSEALAISANALLFDGENLRAALVTAIVSPLVALPLVVFSIDTIKRLDNSKKDYRRAQRIAHIGSWRKGLETRPTEQEHPPRDVVGQTRN